MARICLMKEISMNSVARAGGTTFFFIYFECHSSHCCKCHRCNPESWKKPVRVVLFCFAALRPNDTSLIWYATQKAWNSSATIHLFCSQNVTGWIGYSHNTSLFFSLLPFAKQRVVKGRRGPSFRNAFLSVSFTAPFHHCKSSVEARVDKQKRQRVPTQRVWAYRSIDLLLLFLTLFNPLIHPRRRLCSLLCVCP